MRHYWLGLLLFLAACDGVRPIGERLSISTADWLVLGAADDSLDLAASAPTTSRAGHIAVHIMSPPSGALASTISRAG